MAPDFEIVNPLADTKWDERIRHIAGAKLFHTAAWTRVLTRAFAHEPLYLCRTDGERVSACLPVMEINRRLSVPKGKTLPFTDYCDPLVTNGSDADALLQAAIDYGRARGWRSYQLRGGTGLEESTPFFRTCYGHSIRLEDGSDAAFTAFSSGARRHIRRAEGVVDVRHGDSLEFLETYYRLHRMTRKRQGLFVQPLALFHGVMQEVLKQGLGFVSLAFADGRPIAGAVFAHWNRHAVYLYGASDVRYQHLRPNSAVMWDAVKWFAEEGCRELDLGTTDSENTGLRQYKNTMAARETELQYYRYDYRREEFQSAAPATSTALRVAFCKRMPTAALSLAGTLLYPRHG